MLSVDLRVLLVSLEMRWPDVTCGGSVDDGGLDAAAAAAATGRDQRARVPLRAHTGDIRDA